MLATALLVSLPPVDHTHKRTHRYPFDTQTLRGTFSLVSNVANVDAVQFIRINLTEAAAMQTASHLRSIFPASTWQVMLCGPTRATGTCVDLCATSHTTRRVPRCRAGALRARAAPNR